MRGAHAGYKAGIRPEPKEDRSKADREDIVSALVAVLGRARSGYCRVIPARRGFSLLGRRRDRPRSPIRCNP